MTKPFKKLRERMSPESQRRAAMRTAAALVPTNWLDPLLTGPKAVLGEPPWNCPDIEKLLRAVKARIEGHTEGGE